MTMRSWMLGIAFLAATVSATWADPSARVRAKDPALGRIARGLPAGGKLRVDGLRIDGIASSLDLERFEVWAADAEVLVDGARHAAPQTAYFRGTVEGDPESVVFLAVRPGDGVAGLIARGGAYHGIGRVRRSGALRTRKVDLSHVDGVPFGCETDSLPRLPAPSALVTGDAVSEAASTAAYTARIAVETDYEYYAKFNDTTKALDYMGDVIGYASVIYSREVNTSLVISWSRAVDRGRRRDPWTATSGTSAALDEFMAYWRANMGGVNRTLAHMLSGKGLGGGIGYIGVLCDTQYGYALSGNIDGTFSWDGDAAHDPASVVWDIIVVSHEIGHNFNSPHTQDYCNYGGSPDPVDRCYQGCAGAGIGLPTCTATPSAFGGGKGTIMSYCHQVGGGYANIAMTFGQGHPCGTLPDRVPAQMRAHVVQRAAAFPTCLAAATRCGNGVVEPGETCDAGRARRRQLRDLRLHRRGPRLQRLRAAATTRTRSRVVRRATTTASATRRGLPRLPRRLPGRHHVGGGVRQRRVRGGQRRGLCIVSGRLLGLAERQAQHPLVLRRRRRLGAGPVLGCALHGQRPRLHHRAEAAQQRTAAATAPA